LEAGKASSRSSHSDLARKLATHERKCDAQFKAVFEAIRALMAAPSTTKRTIGFRSESACDGLPTLFSQ
jgi:hypothetical protein